MFPNYKNSIINITATLMNFYGLETKYPIIKTLNNSLKKKNILIILDGLGKSIIKKHLDENDILYTNNCVTSVFPAATVPATTSLRTGLSPMESGYFGWHLFLDRNQPDSLEIFTGKGYYLGEKIELPSFLKIPSFYKRINVPAYEIGPHYFKNGFSTFREGIDFLIEKLEENNEMFAYVYSPTPDNLIHEFGTSSNIVTKKIKELNEMITYLYNSIDNDATIIITADHGLIDIENVCLSDYPEVYNMLEKRPSCEGRATFLFVNDKYRDNFKNTFNKYLESKFLLLSKEEFISSNISGIYDSNNTSINNLLPDFIAIAKENYFLVHDESIDASFIGHHSGTSKEEMEVPLIILTK